MAYVIKDWKKFQHYKDRKPPWIKFYRDILDDKEWYKLDGDAAKSLVMLWLLASEDQDKQGVLPDVSDMAFRLRLPEATMQHHLDQLSHFLLQDDSNMIAGCKQDATPETERETEKEREAEEPPPPDVDKSTIPEKPSGWIGGDPSKISVNNFREWRRTPYAQHHIGIMASLYGGSFVRAEIDKIDKWLAGNPEYQQGNWLKWANNWIARSYKERESKGPPAPISNEQEQTHYANHRRTGAVNKGFTSIGDITVGD